MGKQKEQKETIVNIGDDIYNLLDGMLLYVGRVPSPGDIMKYASLGGRAGFDRPIPHPNLERKRL